MFSTFEELQQKIHFRKYIYKQYNELLSFKSFIFKRKIFILHCDRRRMQIVCPHIEGESGGERNMSKLRHLADVVWLPHRKNGWNVCEYVAHCHSRSNHRLTIFTSLHSRVERNAPHNRCRWLATVDDRIKIGLLRQFLRSASTASLAQNQWANQMHCVQPQTTVCQHDGACWGRISSQCLPNSLWGQWITAAQVITSTIHLNCVYWPFTPHGNTMKSGM